MGNELQAQPRDIDNLTLLSSESLAINGAPNSFSQQFQLGQGWYRTRLRFRISLVVGTGVTAIANSANAFIKNIFMKTDRNEILCNLSGTALYNFLHSEDETLPNGGTQVAAADGDTDVYLDIPHVLPKGFKRPIDTILDTARYKTIQLQVTLGNTADLLVTPGTATVTCTLDAEAIVSASPLPAQAMPNLYRSLFELPPIIPNDQTYIDLDKADDMAINQLMIGTFQTATAGVAFSGVGNNAIINDMDVRDLRKYYVQNRLWGMVQADNKAYYSLETILAGYAMLSFVRDDSAMSALPTGGKSMLRVLWRNDTVVATDGVSVLMDTSRALA